MAEPVTETGGSRDEQDLTGSTVGRFVVRARLGHGGMGEVYRAEDTKLKRPVALKRIAPQLRTDARFRRRFLREAERASALNDHHIAGVYDVLEESGEIFLVMEHVEGQTLRQRLGRPFSPEDFLLIAVQCAEALAAAHAKGIVHRDIKPGNIMVTPAGQVKILDFGVAKRLPSTSEEAETEGESTLGITGTPSYMAPEVLVGKQVDGRADIFSLGVVFHELLTGRNPFRSQTFAATADRILHEVPPPPSRSNTRLSPELDRIVGKMLAKNPAERYATAADLLVDLRRLSQAGPESTTLLGPVFDSRKHKRLRWALRLAVVVLLGAGIVLWRAAGPPAPAERLRVAVLPFSNQTGEQRLDSTRLMFTEMLLLDLSGSPNIQVLPYERLVEITRGFESQDKDITSSEAVRAVADYGDAQFVVVPAMFSVGSTLRVHAEFRSASTGETIGATKVERTLSGSTEDTLYSMLGELAEGIQSYFKGVGRGQDYQARPAGSRPKTVTAALHLNEGRNAFARGEYARALESFQRLLKEDPDFALAHAWMGQIYGLLGYDKKARELSEQATKLVTPETPLADAYFIEANLAESKYDFSAAEHKYLDLIRLYPDDSMWRARLAGIYEKQGQYPKAIATYQEALDHDPNYIVVYQELGELHGRTGNLDQALSSAQKALGLYKALQNREGEGRALLALANIFRLRGEHQRARESVNSALEIFQGSENEFGVLQATKQLGDIQFSEGDQKGARRHYQEVLAASTEPRNNRLVVLTLQNLGVTYSREGNLAKAVEYYERSLAQEELYGEYKDWPSLRTRALAMNNLAAIYIEYGPDPNRGLQLAQEALAIFQMMGDTSWQARNKVLVGLYHMNVGAYDRALESFQQAQTLSHTAEDKEMQAFSAYYSGRCYLFENRYQPALESVTQALSFYQGIPSPFGTTMSRILLGWVYYRMGDAGKARALLEESVREAEDKGYGELLPDGYTALGEVYWERGEKGRAAQAFRRGSELWKEPSVSESSIEARSNLGVLEAENGNLQRGLAYGRQSVERARQLQHRHTLVRTLINLAQIHTTRKEYGRAIDALAEVTSLGEGELGLELRARAFYLQAKALENLGRGEEARRSLAEAQQSIRELQQTLAASYRERFAARRDIELLFP